MKFGNATRFRSFILFHNFAISSIPRKIGKDENLKLSEKLRIPRFRNFQEISLFRNFPFSSIPRKSKKSASGPLRRPVLHLSENTFFMFLDPQLFVTSLFFIFLGIQEKWNFLKLWNFMISWKVWKLGKVDKVGKVRKLQLSLFLCFQQNWKVRNFSKLQLSSKFSNFESWQLSSTPTFSNFVRIEKKCRDSIDV